MSTYRVEWPCCGDVTETQAWEPERCPFCEPRSPAAPTPPVDAVPGEPVAYCYELHGEGQLLIRRFHVHKTAQPFGVPDKDYSEEFEIREMPLYATPTAPQPRKLQ